MNDIFYCRCGLRIISLESIIYKGNIFILFIKYQRNDKKVTEIVIKTKGSVNLRCLLFYAFKLNNLMHKGINAQEMTRNMETLI